ncbi:hypothetical protein [Alteromonas flava]|nr:hypothetical protein [Alteromonas flava]
MNITVSNEKSIDSATKKQISSVSINQWIRQWASNYVALVNATMALK